MQKLTSVALLAFALPVFCAAQSKESQEVQPHVTYDGKKIDAPKNPDAPDDLNGRSLTGVVHDQQDNGVPMAVVQLKNLRTGKVRNYIAGKDGAYRFDYLSPKDDYQVFARLKEMQSPVRKLSKYDTRPEPYFRLVLSEPVPPEPAAAGPAKK